MGGDSLKIVSCYGFGSNELTIMLLICADSHYFFPGVTLACDPAGH